MDWDAGFTREFSVVAAQIVPGASFRAILRAALDRDHIVRLYVSKSGGNEEVRTRIGRWPRDLGQEDSFVYSNGERIVHVWESRTIAGGIVRAARDVTPQRIMARAPEIEPDGAGDAGGRPEAGIDGRANGAVPAALPASSGMLVLRSHTERELLRVKEAAAQAAEHKKHEFLSRVSHEIRTPMNVVLGMAEILSETELSGEQRRYLEMMTANGNVLLEQIGSILDLARIGSGHWQVDQGSGILSRARSGRAVNASAPTAESAPNLAGYRILLVDDAQINRLIVREMLSGSGAEVSEAESGAAALAAIRNAAAAGEHYRIVTLEMRMAGMNGSEVAARIRDESLALRPVVIMLSSDELRSEFTRLKELGLDAFLTKPITRKELFHAIRRIIPETNRAGAETRAERSAGEISRERPASASREAATAASPLRILVADDSADNRLLVNAYLRHESHLLDFAENGQIAVEKFTTNRYDVVLMDIQMPQLDGFGATKIIRKWESDQGRAATPIIALTASSAIEEDVRRILEAGCDMHVSKPVKKSVLLAAIRKAVVPRGTSASALAPSGEAIPVAPHPEAVASDEEAAREGAAPPYDYPAHG